MPTPALRATASRLAPATPALKIRVAASSTRSRLRSESARGFRSVSAFFAALIRPDTSTLLKNGGCLRITSTHSQRSQTFPGPTPAACTSASYRLGLRLFWRSPAPSQGVRMSLCIRLIINGEPREIALDDPRITLLDLLRERLALTGAKKGCDRGQCGACTVHVEGRRINACLALAASLDGASVVTIEGLAQGEILHPVQAAFIAH